jgi:hypothetical protein
MMCAYCREGAHNVESAKNFESLFTESLQQRAETPAARCGKTFFSFYVVLGRASRHTIEIGR